MNQILKIDIHAHATAFPYTVPPSQRTGKSTISPEELLPMYDRLGIEVGVLQTLVSPEAMLSPITSESVKWIADQYPDRFRWFCGVDPRAMSNICSSDLSWLLKHYKALGAKGLGELNANMYADDPMIDNLFSHCEACDMPVMIHMGRKIGGCYGLVDEPGLPRLEKMLQKHPGMKLIGHSIPFWNEISITGTEGKVTEGRLAELMRRYENLCCDLSAGSGSHAMMRDPDYAVAFLTEFQDRIFYGCDIVSDSDEHPFAFRDFLDGMYEDGCIPPTVYRKICRENAEKLLGMKEKEQ